MTNNSHNSNPPSINELVERLRILRQVLGENDRTCCRKLKISSALLRDLSSRHGIHRKFGPPLRSEVSKQRAILDFYLGDSQKAQLANLRIVNEWLSQRLRTPAIEPRPQDPVL